MKTSPGDVLSFWFGEPAHDAPGLMKQIDRWYRGGPEVDTAIRERFAEAVEAALAGKLDHWADDPRERLALVILLDQFPRSMFRSSPRAFEGAAKAEALVCDAFDRGLDRDMAIQERNFLIMALLHGEKLELQERAVKLTAEQVERAPDWAKPIWSLACEQAAKYREVISRFGRFPHRNEALGRTTTPDEAEFLTDWAAKAPPKMPS